MANSTWFGSGRKSALSNEDAGRLIDSLPAPAGALRMADGVVLYVNEALEEAFGAPRSQLLGRHIRHFFATPLQADNLTDQLASLGHVRDSDVTWQRPNGTLMDVRLSSRVANLGSDAVAVFLIKDVTAERAAEAEARRLREAIDNMGEGFVLYDSEQRLVFVNKKYREMYPELAAVSLPGVRRDDIRRIFDASGAAAQMPDAYLDLKPEFDAESGHETGRATREVEFRRFDGTNIKISDFQLSDGSIIGVRTDITEIRARDRHLRAIYENAAVGIALVDDEGQCAEANPTLFRLLRAGDDPGPMSCERFVNERDYPAFRDSMNQLISGEVANFAIPATLNCFDNTVLDARIRATRIFDDAGNPLYNLVFVVDISDIKDAEARLPDSEARYRSLVEDQHAFVVRFHMDGTITFANQAFADYLGLTIDETLKINFYNLVPEADHPALREHLESLGADRTGKTRENRFVFADSSIRWLQWTNRAIPDANGNLLEYQAYGLDVTERHLAEAALQESQARLAEAQEVAHIGSWYREVNTNTLTYSDEVFRILGISPETSVPSFELYVSLNHPGDRDTHAETISANMQAETAFSLDHRVVRPDGEIRFVHLRSEPVLDEHGDQIARRGTIQDVTARKLTEIELATREAELAEAQWVGYIGSWYRNLSNNALTYSDEVYRILGITPEDFETNYENFNALVHPDDRDLRRTQVMQNEADGTAFECDHRIVRPDGAVRHVHQRSEPVLDAGGNQVARRGIIQDITERKEVEAELAQAQHIGRIGNWYRDVRTGIVRYSDEAYHILGLSPETADLSPAGFRSMIHPADLKHVDGFLKGWSENTGIYEYENRIVRPDGSVRHVYQRSEPVFDSDGAVMARRGVIQDVTERAQAELALAESQSRMQAILDNVGATVSYVDRNWQFKFVNHAIAELYDRDAADIEGQRVDELVGPQVTAEISPWFEKAIAGEQVTFDIERSYPDGSTRDMNFIFVPDRSAGGVVNGIFMLGTDITERKEGEKASRAGETRLRLITDNLPVFISYIDRNLRYRFVNQHYEQVYGIDRTDITGMRVKDVIGEQNFARAEPVLLRALGGDSVTVDEPWIIPPGRDLFLRRVYVPDVDAGGEVVGVYVLVHDLSDNGLQAAASD